ncbi:hypothetical protein KBY84_15270 [Cyanobium sp. N.Huapi 1H5]|nr:hypothetical protein [Cyanobium sp. N.Huapi 1H5]
MGAGHQRVAQPEQAAAAEGFTAPADEQQQRPAAQAAIEMHINGGARLADLGCDRIKAAEGDVAFRGGAVGFDRRPGEFRLEALGLPEAEVGLIRLTQGLVDQTELKGDPGVARLLPEWAQDCQSLLGSSALPMGVGADEGQHRICAVLRRVGQPAIRQGDGLAETLFIHQLLGFSEQSLRTQLLKIGLDKDTGCRTIERRAKLRWSR